MSTGLKLYLYQTNSLLKKIALAANRSHNVIIGSGENVTVKLNNKLISSQHAQFIFDFHPSCIFLPNVTSFFKINCLKFLKICF